MALLLGLAHHGLYLEKLLESVLTPFAAVAGLLVAAEGSAEVDAGAVQMHVAGAQVRGDAQRALRITRRHIARQSVRRIVGDADGLLLTVVGQDAEHRAEDLLARYRHVVAHVGEHGRAHVVALAQTLGSAGTDGDPLGPFLAAARDSE